MPTFRMAVTEKGACKTLQRILLADSQQLMSVAGLHHTRIRAHSDLAHHAIICTSSVAHYHSQVLTTSEGQCQMTCELPLV